MARIAPPDRLARLLECATRVFIAQGYRRTQMDDVAREMGVAKGTLYRYVESKEALFDAVVRHLDDPPKGPPHRPLRAPAAGATLERVRQRMAREPILRDLAAIVDRPARGAVRVEIESIVRMIYATLGRNRTAIKLADRCAADYPELAAVWYRGGRLGVLAVLIRYLESRVRAGRIPAPPDVAIAARIVLETIAFWAVHRHWDPAPQPMNDRAAEDSVVRFVVAALLAGKDCA
ncbi:MAG: TetR/AcrR family transcriptional regulator [Candidatus Binatia bacterium]